MGHSELRWVTIFATPNQFLASLVRERLLDANVDCVVFDTRDSIYNMFGEFELKVPETDAAFALMVCAQVAAEDSE